MPQQYVVRWSGGRIGSGATVLNFVSIAGGSAAQSIADATKAFIDARKASFPNEVTFTFSNEVLELASDGTLIQVYNVTPPAAVVGTGATEWVNGSGRMVRLTTGSVVAGRRLVGRVFLVPSLGISNTDGNVSAGTITADKAALVNLMAAVSASGSHLAVWSRTHALVAQVTSADTVSRPTTLRTRNDRS